MKCFHHNDHEAISICVNCGRALCKACTSEIESNKIICSNDCEISISKFENIIELIQSKTLNQNKISAYGFYIGGFIFGLFGLYNIFFKSTHYVPLAIFIIMLSVAFFIWGTWYLKASKKTSPNMPMNQKSKTTPSSYRRC